MQKPKLSLQLLSFCLGLTFLYACGGDSENIPDVSNIPMDIEIHRLEKEISALSSKEEIQDFLNNNPILAEQYLLRSKYPNDSSLVNRIQFFLDLEFNDTLLYDVEEVFADFTEIEQELENTFRRVKYYYPDFVPPKVCTIVTGFGSFGFGQDIYVSKELIVIGLDFFAGDQSIYRPQDIPNYIQRRYNPEYIAPTVAQFLSSEYIAFEDTDRTMLSDMILHGKSLYFMEKMVPSAPDSVIIGYTAQETYDSYSNESIIWGYFIQNDLLYETNRFKKNRFVGESPRVHEIAEECPGRIGRWLGWQIVRSLAKSDTLSFQEIIALPSAEEVLRRAKYRPE